MSVPSEEPASEGAPEWMVSYADMITILMSFFAVMFSIAMSKNAKKDVPMMKSLQRQFGKFGGPPMTFFLPFGAALTARAATMTIPPMNSRNRGLAGDFASRHRANVWRPGHDRRHDLFRLRNERPERRAAATASNGGQSIFGGKPQKIEILSHTLGRAVDADEKLRDNWNLAHARCNNTMRYLVSLGIDPQRIRMGVAAQFEPICAGGDVLLLEKTGSVEVFTPNEFAEDARAESNDHARD